MGEGRVIAGPQSHLPGMAEGRVPQVVTQGGGFGQILIQAQGPGHGAGDLGDLQRVGQAGAVMIPHRRQEHLGLVHQPPEGLTVDDPVPIPLVLGAQGGGVLGPLSPPGIFRTGGIGAKEQRLPPGQPLRHRLVRAICRTIHRMIYRTIRLLLFLICHITHLPRNLLQSLRYA